MYKEIIEILYSLAEPEFARWVKPFLSINEKSDEIVLGVRTPKLRNLAKKYKNINNEALIRLLRDKIHEARALALFIMLIKSKKEPLEMCQIYLSHLDYINNWDLIDYTCPHIVAPNVETRTLRELANSDYMWANRVAMVSTIYYIKQGDFSLALEFAKKFKTHPHHLMHKAAGWMLREVGKKDVNILKAFLQEHSATLPSVMRSYAKEKLK